MREPVTTLDPRYSDPAAVATPWAVTRAALEAAQLAWLVSVRPDGRPHATWDGRWAFEVRGDRLYHPAGFPPLTYSVYPERAFAFAEGTFGHTLYRFPGA